MALKLFELVGVEESRPFSPFCWRIRMALAHKGLAAESVPWRFTETSAIARYNSEKVPVLLDGDAAVCDSWTIANYLEDSYPDRPSLFGGNGGRAVSKMLNWWGDLVIFGGLSPLIVADIVTVLGPEDAAYFRQSREARYGQTLEQVSAGRDQALDGFRRSLEPLRRTLKTQPFLGGDGPLYADYIVFGGFQWARATSPYQLLKPDDPIYAWRDRLLDAFGGLARNSGGYPV